MSPFQVKLGKALGVKKGINMPLSDSVEALGCDAKQKVECPIKREQVREAITENPEAENRETHESLK